ncbi:MAG: S1C family serine protease [Thermoanaerobaculia bacterium]
MPRIIRNLLVAGACVAAMSAYAQEPKKEPKKEERKQVEKIVVRDGKVLRSGNGPLMIDRMMRGGYLGVQMSEMTPALREHFRAPREAGVLVSEVEEGSPAASAGVRVGDVITAIDGKNVESSWDLRSAVRKKKDGEQVKVGIVRNGAPQNLVAIAQERSRPAVDLGGLPRHIEIPEHFEIPPIEIDEEALKRVQTYMESPEWKARLESLDCGKVQQRMEALEGRLKELEKKLK